MEQSVAATLHPAKIIIATRIGDNYGGWVNTDCLSITPPNVDDEELGVIVLRHILLSTIRDFTQSEAVEFRERYKKLAQFKSEGQLIKNSKLATVILDGNKLRFEPKENKYWDRKYEYWNMPDAKFSIEYPCPPEQIGANLQIAWTAAL